VREYQSMKMSWVELDRIVSENLSATMASGAA